MKTKKYMSVKKNKKLSTNDVELIDVLYSTPTKIAEWFSNHCANVSLEECKKMMIKI